MTTLGPACPKVTSTLTHCTHRDHSQNLDLRRTLASAAWSLAEQYEYGEGSRWGGLKHAFQLGPKADSG